jgi:hypothetical protein
MGIRFWRGCDGMLSCLQCEDSGSAEKDGDNVTGVSSNHLWPYLRASLPSVEHVQVLSQITLYPMIPLDYSVM